MAWGWPVLAQDHKLMDSRDCVLPWLFNAGHPGKEKITHLLPHSSNKYSLSTKDGAGSALPLGLQQQTKRAQSPVLTDVLAATAKWTNRRLND